MPIDHGTPDYKCCVDQEFIVTKCCPDSINPFHGFNWCPRVRYQWNSSCNGYGSYAFHTKNAADCTDYCGNQLMQLCGSGTAVLPVLSIYEKQYICGWRSGPNKFYPISGAVAYGCGYNKQREMVLDSGVCECPPSETCSQNPTPPVCYRPPNTDFIIDGITYTDYFGSTLDNWTPPIPGTTSSWCLTVAGGNCSTPWIQIYQPTNHINDTNLVGVQGFGNHGFGTEKNSYEVQTYGGMAARNGISEFNGPFYRTISTYGSFSAAIGGISPIIRFSSIAAAYTSGITNPTQIAQGLSYCAVIGDYGPGSPGITFIEFIKKTDMSVVENITANHANYSTEYTFVAGNKEDITPLIVFPGAIGVSMNNCGTVHGINPPGCTCNTGDLYCSAIGCSYCTDFVCSFDPTCCDTEWGAGCITEASELFNGVVGKVFPYDVNINGVDYTTGQQIPPGIICGTTGPTIIGVTYGQQGKDVFAAVHDSGFNYWSIDDTGGDIFTGGVFGHRPDLMIKKVMGKLLPNEIEASTSGYTLCCGDNQTCINYQQQSIFFDKISVGKKHAVVTVGSVNPYDIYAKKETPWLFQFSGGSFEGGTFARVNTTTTWGSQVRNINAGLLRPGLPASVSVYNAIPKAVVNIRYATPNFSDIDLDSLYKVGVTSNGQTTLQYDIEEELCDSLGNFKNGLCRITGSTSCFPILDIPFGDKDHPVWYHGVTLMPTISLINADVLCRSNSIYSNGSWEWVSAGGTGETCSVLRCYGNAEVGVFKAFRPTVAHIFANPYHKSIKSTERSGAISPAGGYLSLGTDGFIYPTSSIDIVIGNIYGSDTNKVFLNTRYDKISSSSQISDDSLYVCGIDTTGEVNCLVDWPSGTPRFSVDATDISLGHNHTAVVLSDKGLTGWGDNSSGQLNFPTSKIYTKVSAGNKFTCAITDTGGVTCYGENGASTSGLITTIGNLPAPTSSLYYVDVVCGMNYACVLTNTGDARCYGIRSGHLGSSKKIIATANDWVISVGTDNIISQYFGVPYSDNDSTWIASWNNAPLGNIIDVSIRTLDASILYETLPDPPPDDRIFLCWGGRYNQPLADYPSSGLQWPWNAIESHNIIERDSYTDGSGTTPITESVTHNYVPCQIDISSTGSPVFYYRTSPSSIKGDVTVVSQYHTADYVATNILGKVKYYDSTSSSWKEENSYGDSRLLYNESIDTFDISKFTTGHNYANNGAYDWAPTYPVIASNNTWVTNRYKKIDTPCPDPSKTESPCCLTDYSCVDETTEYCNSKGGEQISACESCREVSCCSSGVCTTIAAWECLGINGSILQDGACQPTDCEILQTGGCCMSETVCVENKTHGECKQDGGFNWNPSACGSCAVNRPCCIKGDCSLKLPGACTTEGGIPYPTLTQCNNVPDGCTGPCCLDDECIGTYTKTECTNQNGTFTPGVECTKDACTFSCCDDWIGPCCLEGDGGDDVGCGGAGEPLCCSEATTPGCNGDDGDPNCGDSGQPPCGGVCGGVGEPDCCGTETTPGCNGDDGDPNCGDPGQPPCGGGGGGDDGCPYPPCEPPPLPPPGGICWPYCCPENINLPGCDPNFPITPPNGRNCGAVGYPPCCSGIPNQQGCPGDPSNPNGPYPPWPPLPPNWTPPIVTGCVDIPMAPCGSEGPSCDGVTPMSLDDCVNEAVSSGTWDVCRCCGWVYYWGCPNIGKMSSVGGNCIPTTPWECSTRGGVFLGQGKTCTDC